jgi:hypothetical protein
MSLAATSRRAAATMAVIAVLATGLGAATDVRAQTPDVVLPKLSVTRALALQNDPVARSRFLSLLPRQSAIPAQAPPSAAQALAPLAGGTWQAAPTAPATGLCNPLLLTDGTVIVHVCNARTWYRLTPNNVGSYVAGTWSQIASLPTGYQPQYNASAVLPDGRVIIEGGEYNGGNTEVWTNLGAIYDPVANTWTSVSPPAGSGWSQIGDAQSVVLPNGTFLLGGCCANPPVDALFNAATLGWSSTNAPSNYQDEQGYTLLPTDKVMTIDVWDPPATQQYDPAGGRWSATASTPVSLVDPSQCGNFEIGPAIVRADGTLVAFGGNTGCSGQADPTAIYNVAANSWVQGPNVPAICGTNGTTSCDLADAPAALLPNGNILFAASSGYGDSPTHFFEFTTANTINQVADTLFFASSSGAYFYNFLVLPTGQVLATDFSSRVEIYTPVGSANASWAPTITSVPASLTAGQTFQLGGTQLNGLSQAAAYGDDDQSATNYPLVRITNNATGHVFYARTFGQASRSIAPGVASTTSFLVPSNIETGAGSLVAVANGIASQPVAITIGAAGTFTLSVSETGSGTVTSSPAGINCGSTCAANFAAATQVTLTATPATGWVFGSWGGACSGSGACVVTMNAAQSVSATFIQTFVLSVSETGSGTVTSSPAGINCGSTCSASFATGTQVTLTAAPAGGATFSGWGGACSGTGSCVVTMNAAQSVSATFAPPMFTLSVSKTGGGTVTSSPAGINCGSTCSAGFAGGTQVTLTATPARGSSFGGWSGACSGTGSCVVSMSGPQSVTASFTLIGPAQTFVSGGGNDANDCSRATPCQTLATAVARTALGGEVTILDAAGYGGVTITQAISIIDDGAGEAGVLVSGTDGIVVNAGAGDVVMLRGLFINGTGTGHSGVVFNSGAMLVVRDCVIEQFATGITFAPNAGSGKLIVDDTVVHDNATGLVIRPTAGVGAVAAVAGLHATHNSGSGLVIDGSGGGGTISVTVTRSVAEQNGGHGLSALSGPGASVTVGLVRAKLALNAASGVQADQSAGGIASVTVDQSLLSGNATAASSVGGGAVLTAQNNEVVGNQTNGTFTGIAPLR